MVFMFVLNLSSQSSGWLSWPTKQNDVPLDGDGCPFQVLFPGIISEMATTIVEGWSTIAMDDH